MTVYTSVHDVTIAVGLYICNGHPWAENYAVATIKRLQHFREVYNELL